ncbi:hypothetical protein XH98_30730 [Bradyrhizobium sp. CCBAU 51745]|nr:hypothetical protein [Bradyrhizobium sp. CCBAU 51745]
MTLLPQRSTSGGLDLDGMACKIGERFKWVGLGRTVRTSVLGRIAASLPSPRGDQITIYAPSLRTLPQNAMLVMATLPVIDWNDCLVRDLHASPKAPPCCYAAVVMIDPFACWEDLGDLLQDAKMTGVTNFPPASMIERTPAGVPLDSGQELELRRMEWFASRGFKVLFVAADEAKMAAAEQRLGSQLDGLVYLGSDALALSIGSDIGLVSLGFHRSSSIPRFSLEHAARPKQSLRQP